MATPREESKFEQKGNNATLEIVSKKQIKTLEELIEVAQIDTDTWEIERYVCNKWEVAGFDKHSKTFTVQELWQVKAIMKKRVDAILLRDIGAEIISEMKKHSTVVKKRPVKSSIDSCLCEVDLFDPHIGKLAWGMESGEDYDIKIASERYTRALEEIIDRSAPFKKERFLLPLTGDFFNVNSSTAATFAGTPQSEDSRWKKTFRTGWNLLKDSIETLSQIAPVTVIVVVGNHDTESLFYAGEVLSGVFANNKNITIDNSPKVRKYYRYGVNLTGFTHGSDEKLEQLPMIMANEAKSDYAETLYREFHVGHFHSKREYRFLSTKEDRGVTVRVIRSLSSVDEWHYKKGYIGAIKTGEAFITHKTEGLIANLSVNL
jgi:hypothetical protein